MVIYCTLRPAGLALGIAMLGLPWKVVGVMLAGSAATYTDLENRLAEEFCTSFGCTFQGKCLSKLTLLNVM